MYPIVISFNKIYFIYYSLLCIYFAKSKFSQVYEEVNDGWHMPQVGNHGNIPVVVKDESQWVDYLLGSTIVQITIWWKTLLLTHMLLPMFSYYSDIRFSAADRANVCDSSDNYLHHNLRLLVEWSLTPWWHPLFSSSLDASLPLSSSHVAHCSQFPMKSNNR